MSQKGSANTWVVVILVLIIVGVLVWYFVYRKSYTSPTTSSTPTSSTQSTPSTTTPTGSTTVSITASGFSPSEITAKIGTTVTWQNKDSQPHWVASDPHPTHTGLPGFDAKKNINPGESYSFTFEKEGTFGYHDHLNTSVKGTVKVTK